MYPQMKKAVGMLSKIDYFRLIGGSNPIPQRSITSDLRPLDHSNPYPPLLVTW